MKNYSVTIEWVTKNLNPKSETQVIHLCDDEEHALEIALAILKTRFRKTFLKWVQCSISEVVYPTQSNLSFQSGTIKIESSSINDLKELVEELDFLSKHSGTDLSGTLTDLCFDIERAYQAFHGLEEDNFESVHKS